MNAGKDYGKAIVAAWRNAKADNSLRYVHSYNGTWWISKTAPNAADTWGGCPRTTVYPDGRVFDYTQENPHKHVYDFMPPGPIEARDT